MGVDVSIWVVYFFDGWCFDIVIQILAVDSQLQLQLQRQLQQLICSSYFLSSQTFNNGILCQGQDRSPYFFCSHYQRQQLLIANNKNNNNNNCGSSWSSNNYYLVHLLFAQHSLVFGTNTLSRCSYCTLMAMCVCGHIQYPSVGVFCGVRDCSYSISVNVVQCPILRTFIN